MNLLDRAIGWVSPAVGLRRARERYAIATLRRGYEGAKTGHRTEGWVAAGTSANAEIAPALARLRDRSRDLVRNNPYATKSVGALVSDLVGTGIVPRARAESAEAADRLWERFADACDADGLTDVFRARVAEVLERLRIGALADRYPSELSGGQQQRVALARELVAGARLLLMDEPLSNLDARLRMDMRAELKRLHAEMGITIVYVTHDQMAALTLSTRMAVMREGVVQQLGTLRALYDQPANLFVAEFLSLSQMSVLDGHIDGAAVRIGRHRLALDSTGVTSSGSWGQGWRRSWRWERRPRSVRQNRRQRPQAGLAGVVWWRWLRGPATTFAERSWRWARPYQSAYNPRPALSPRLSRG